MWADFVFMLWRERFGGGALDRCPEPSSAMNDLEAVRAFHGEGAVSGSLIPIYHFNALAISQLAPLGGTVVDLGSGSGQFLSYLGHCRPDLRIIGFDLAPNMVALGQELLKASGLSPRVELKGGDMTNFLDDLPEQVDLISSIYSLHHLPTQESLGLCISQVAQARRLRGCGLWIFDFSRPRHPKTPNIFPKVFSPQSPQIFCDDTSKSLLASWSFAELSEALTNAQLDKVKHVRARFLPLYQIHWLFPQQQDRNLNGHANWMASALTGQDRKNFLGLKTLFLGQKQMAPLFRKNAAN